MTDVGPLTAERSVYQFGAPQHISTGFAYWLHYCSDVAKRRPTKLCTMFGRLLDWYTKLICAFSGALAPWRNFVRCKIHFTSKSCVLILAALLHGTRAAAVSQTLWRGTENGITEVSQRAAPIFGWTAITLGIGPHSSWFYYWSFSREQRK